MSTWDCNFLKTGFAFPIIHYQSHIFLTLYPFQILNKLHPTLSDVFSLFPLIRLVQTDYRPLCSEWRSDFRSIYRLVFCLTTKRVLGDSSFDKCCEQAVPYSKVNITGSCFCSCLASTQLIDFPLLKNTFKKSLELSDTTEGSNTLCLVLRPLWVFNGTLSSSGKKRGQGSSRQAVFCSPPPTHPPLLMSK